MRRSLLLSLVLLLLAPACKEGAETDAVSSKLSLERTELSSEEGSQRVEVAAQGDWILSSDAPWLLLHLFGERSSQTISGSGSEEVVLADWTANDTDEVRTATLTLYVGDDVRVSCILTQDAGIVHEVVPDENTSYSWMEMPAVPDHQKGNTYTHIMKVQGSYSRNYTFLWDRTNLLAPWVAYPLNKTLIDASSGSNTRTDDWGVDPLLPAYEQPVLINRSYRKYDEPTKWSGYDRGHQLPSADRYNYSDDWNANRQTFYGTNMTAQLSSFNQGIWGDLEGKVRDWSKGFDTLYVVTGCTVDGSTLKVLDDELKAITVPTHYFKVLLGYAGASTNMRRIYEDLKDTGYYTAIAFWFDNAAYANKNYMLCKMSVDELESLTGFDFFANLPAAIGSGPAADVEKSIGKHW